ncbi:MAG: D-alanine--D-alanine ligase family protein [Nitrospinota bacterium]
MREGRPALAILFGGRSAEHEVSCASAASVMAVVDRGRYDLYPVYIGRDGEWRLLPSPEAAPSEGRPVLPPGQPTERRLLSTQGEPLSPPLDIVFPLLHGTYGEDGTLQGLMELAGIALVGSGTLGAALSMDKSIAKVLFAAAGIPVLRARVIRKGEWVADRGGVTDSLVLDLPFPLFAKPARLGSSVGVHRADNPEMLGWAVDEALAYDPKVLVEECAGGREVECAILASLDGGPPIASPLAEVRPKRGWYDYEAKYTEGLTDILIPASLPAEVEARIQELARRAFAALDCAGYARADFFYRESAGEVFLNEVNSIPGFTATSVFPRLMAAAGIRYAELVERLLRLALLRQQEEKGRRFSR